MDTAPGLLGKFWVWVTTLTGITATSIIRIFSLISVFYKVKEDYVTTERIVGYNS